MVTLDPRPDTDLMSKTVQFSNSVVENRKPLGIIPEASQQKGSNTEANERTLSTKEQEKKLAALMCGLDKQSKTLHKKSSSKVTDEDASDE